MQNTSYLESKILTAPPHRLHLMLIEGAIRFGKQAEESLSRGEQVAAATPLLRMLDIVGEMLAAVREKQSELNQKLSEVYAYLFRGIAVAKVNADVAVLGEVLKLLEYERQTWQMLCDKLSEQSSQKTPAPHSAGFHSGSTQAANTGISFQA